MKKKVSFGIGIVLMVLSSILIACSTEDSGPGKYDSFAQCLTGKKTVMYGTEWCPHCKDQKKVFGSSFKYVTYVDCDKDRNACAAAGVKGYPTWVIAGKTYSGGKDLPVLSALSGCELVANELPEENPLES